jgi:hypothetical protein
MWTNQTKDPALWTSFTTPDNKTVRFPPRRYILRGQTVEKITPATLNNLRSFLQKTHHPSSAPEPMINLTSHIHLDVHILDWKTLRLTLTNTCSRKTRQEIFLQSLAILKMTPEFLFYQEKDEDENLETMETRNRAQLLTGLLESKQIRQTLEPIAPPISIISNDWTNLLTHVRRPPPPSL